ncbi:MAG: ArnT family glycosyltransferase, partial [Vicinamibacterales bacterium]
LPPDEFGLRLSDALLGACAFLYVFMLGRWQSGVVGGVAAVLVLYTLDPLVHGLRTNTMEAALLLSYAGGVYHFARWVDAGGGGPAAWHRWPVALYFTLGFLTKFVAILFLPLVCLSAVLLRRDAWSFLRSKWREWLGPVALVLALSAPWFVYQTVVTGQHVWAVMFGQHIYARFTGALDVSHLHPWHYYFSSLWLQLQMAGSHWIVAAGAVALAVAAWRRDGWLPRVFLVWGIVPIALVSLGSSKLFHYILPFLPPAALGAGYAASLVFTAANALLAAYALPRIRPWFPARLNSDRAPARMFGKVLVVMAGLAALTALVTAIRGGLSWEVSDVEILRNTSMTRPFLIAAVLLCVAGELRWAARSLAMPLLLVLLPSAMYPRMLERAAIVDRPLHAARDCIIDVRKSGAAVGKTVYNAAPSLTYHSYNYYLRAFEPWVRIDKPEPTELRRRILEPGHQTPVIISSGDYARVALPITEDRAASGHGPPLVGFSADPGLVILLPGPYAPCAADAARAGARPLGFAPEWEPSS